MRIICNREELSEAFALAASVSPLKSPKEILRNVKFVTEGDRLVLMATDTEIGIRIDLPEGSVDVVEEGDAVLPVARTRSILRDSDAEQLEIDTDDQGAVIRGGRSKFRLASEDPAGFPSINEFAAKSYHEINSRLFRQMLRRTSFAIEENSKNYALGGVLIEFDDKTVRSVGTDGKRCAVMEGSGVPVGDHSTSELSTIIPARSIKIIEQAIEDGSETLLVAVGANDIKIKSSRASISTRLLEGRFPKWERILPEEPAAHPVDILAGTLQSAVRQASVVTDFESNGVDFTFGDGTLKLEASTAEIGESSVEVPIGYDGDTVLVRLDYTLIDQFCKVLEPETHVVIELPSVSGGPALFSTGDGYRYVTMPMYKIKE